MNNMNSRSVRPSNKSRALPRFEIAAATNTLESTKTLVGVDIDSISLADKFGAFFTTALDEIFE
jgi:hypothetical protein